MNDAIYVVVIVEEAKEGEQKTTVRGKQFLNELIATRVYRISTTSRATNCSLPSGSNTYFH